MNISQFLELLFWFVPTILTIGTLVGIYHFPALSGAYKNLFLYLLICLLTDILSRIVGSIHGSNLILFIIFSIFEMIFFYYFFQKYLFKKENIKWKIIVVISTFYLLLELYFLSEVNPREFQTYSKSLTSLVSLLMTFDYLLIKLKDKTLNFRIIKFSSVFIIYQGLNLIILLPFNYLINVPSPVKFYFWLFLLIITLIFYGFIIIEIWKNGMRPKQLQHG